ncbi:MAG: rRNA maturation RNase YbeY [Patescibacteria group bacterium]|nr:rRNA maturation RNase YbeY [Patescibacteria group bacterium]
MIEVNNLTNNSINEELLKSLGRHVLIQEGVEEAEVSVAIVKEQEIQKLNRIYRKKDKPTDVLSFGEDSKISFSNSGAKLLGEIIISPSQIAEGGQINLQQVFIHGLLHLLGYDHHSKKDLNIMQKKQKEYLTSFFKKYGSE